MARIILQWLNDEVKLSHEVTSLSEDFRNGYLLGELLHKYNQQHQFHRFVDKDTPDAKIANFCLLEPTMRHIGVHFNSQVAYDIMNARPGAMKTLLYEIRTVLESAKSMSKSADGHQMKRVMQIIKPSIPFYDKTMSATFENAIRSMVDNPNDLLMERATHKFSQMTHSFHQSVTDSYSQQMSDIRYELKRTKEIEREKRRHEKEFQATWDQMNKDQWKKNQIIARNRRNLSRTVSAAAQHRETARRVLENTSARDKAINSINDFEERVADMKKKGDHGGDTSLLALKTVGSVDDGSGIPTLTYLDEGTLRAGMIQNQREMQDRNEKLQLRQLERDRRRKRYVRLKESDDATVLQMEAEGDIFTRVLTTSELEEVEKLAKFRIMVYKDLFLQNATTRQDLLAERRKEYEEYLNRCVEYDADIELSWVITNRVMSQVARLDALEEAKAAAYNQESIETVWREIDRILDLTDWVVNMRALGAYSGGTDLPKPKGGNVECTEGGDRIEGGVDEKESLPSLLPKTIMRDVSCMYAAVALPVPTALPVPHEVNVYENLPLSLSWKPAVPDTTWLLRQPFRGANFMADVVDAAAPTSIPADIYCDTVASATDGAAVIITEDADTPGAGEVADSTAVVEVTDATPATPPPSAEVISPSQMSAYLTRYDCDSFVSSISAFDPPPVDSEAGDAGKGGKASDKKKDASGAKKGKNDIEEVETGVKVIPPAWIAATPAGSVVGEVVVATRCVADPIPAHPIAPKSIPTFPLRLILCGASYALRKSVASALETEFGVSVLRVDELVSTAVVLGEKLALDSDEQARSSLELTSLRIYRMCQRGHAVDDDSYVSLLVEAICAINSDSPGYVVEDFPTTRDQASKLVTALSGIDYDSDRPQTGDKVSPFLTSIPREKEWFDPTKCGLDKAFFIAVPPSVIARNRICLRKDLRSGEVVSMSEDTKSVETLADIVTPRNAMDTISLHIATSSHAAGPMQRYLDNLGIGSAYLSEDGTESSIVERVIANVREFHEARQTPRPEEIADSVSSPDNTDVHEDSTPTDTVTSSAEAEGSATSPGEPTLPPVILQEGTLPPRLAKILANVWNAGEIQTVTSCQQFFAAMREIHYHMIQRRGSIRQVVVTQSLLRDSKQDLFDEFRDQFNSFENDFRYDAELMNELYLRTLELRDQFWEISERKAASSKAVIQKIALDGVAKVFIHQARCEGASLLQSYLGLFVSGLNVLFDYMRATSSYEYSRAYGQVLEAAAPAVNPTLQTDDTVGKGAKDKKPKPSGGGGSRSPIAPSILWSDMEQLPPSTAEEDMEDDSKNAKKKDAKKDKKGDAPSADPQSFSSQNALSFCDSWSRASFSVDRSLYGGDDGLATSIENAVWHEADRLRKVVEMVTEFVEAQVEWITTQEAQMMNQMNEFIDERMRIELSCTERLGAMINTCIEDNIPIHHQWQIASDAIVVRKDRLVYSPADPPIVPVINDFPPTHLNDEQIEFTVDMLNSLQLGGQLLHEDFLRWLNLCVSGIGPLGHSVGNRGVYYSLALPKLWRHEQADLANTLYQTENISGTKETAGVVAVETVLHNMQAYGEEISNALKESAVVEVADSPCCCQEKSGTIS